MKHFLPIIAIVLFSAGQKTEAQSSNFIAQGHYYKAKELYEAKKYPDALKYIQNAKTSLQGTNYQLQYLHILSLVIVEDYVAAKKEMETYFDILDNPEKAKGFTKNVERLTDDETKALSKLMIDIMEKASGNNRELNLKKLNEQMKLSVGRIRNIKVGDKIHTLFISANSIRLDGDNVTLHNTRVSHYNYRPKSIRIWNRVTARFYFRNEYPCDYLVDEGIYSFRLTDIVSISKFNDEVSNNVLGVVEIKLRASTGKFNSKVHGPDKKITAKEGTEGVFNSHDVGKCIDSKIVGNRTASVNTIYFNYLKSDPANFNTIKSLLEALKN